MISIIHPSRGRPEQAYNTFRNWTKKADDLSRIQYVLSVDHDDIRNNSPQYLNWGMPDKLNFFACMGWNKNAIEAINYAAQSAIGDLLVVISDDFSCPEHWDTLLLNELEGKSDFIVKTRDGLQPTLITLPILDRQYYNRFGYVYNSGYVHMWSDTEMTVVGHMLGRVIEVDIMFEHLHYTTGKSKKDEINARNDASWRQGEKLFTERLKINFDVENPLITYPEIKWR